MIFFVEQKLCPEYGLGSLSWARLLFLSVSYSLNGWDSKELMPLPVSR